jgi:hypothetical protein
LHSSYDFGPQRVTVDRDIAVLNAEEPLRASSAPDPQLYGRSFSLNQMSIDQMSSLFQQA